MEITVSGATDPSGSTSARPSLVDGQPAPPPWLVAQAEVIAEATAKKLKPLIRAEVRAALRAEARKQARGPQA
jgi:hypothetical protein